MNTTNTAPVHPGITPLLEGLRTLPAEHSFILEAGDFGFEDHGPEWVRQLSDFEGSRTWDQLQDDIAEGRSHIFGRWYRLDGTVIPKSERPAEWQAAEWEGIDEYTRVTPNAVALTVGGFLWISDGVWTPVGEITVDGAPAFRFVSQDELARRWQEDRRARDRAFIDEHADVIDAARPAWDADVSVYGIDQEQPVEVYFSRKVGAVLVEVGMTLRDGVLVPGDEGVVMSVDASGMTPAGAREVASALLEAVAIVEGAEAVSS